MRIKGAYNTRLQEERQQQMKTLLTVLLSAASLTLLFGSPNPQMLRRARRLTLYLTIVIAVFWGTVKPANAYPTGSMSCSDIGDFAAAAVVGKENGRSLEEALETVKKRTAGYPVERKNLTQIVEAIYTEPWAMPLSEEGATVAFTADCEAQAGDGNTGQSSTPPPNTRPPFDQPLSTVEEARNNPAHFNPVTKRYEFSTRTSTHSSHPTGRVAIANTVSANMDCDTLGEFAQAVVQDKAEGGTAVSETAMATMMASASGNKTDLINMLEIIQALWTWAKHMTPEGAKQSFAADCRAQR